MMSESEKNQRDALLTKAYGLADRIKKLGPWEHLDEEDMFGVQAPGSGKIYFVSIMGMMGAHLALAAWEGTNALMGLDEFRDPDSWMRRSEILLIPHLMVSFENRDMIADAERKKMKELGFAFRGKNAWPDLKQLAPGFVPAMPDDDALSDLVVVMEQSIDILEKEIESEGYIFPEDMNENQYLLRKLVKGKGGKKEWKDTYFTAEVQSIRYEMRYDTIERDRLKGLHRMKSTLQADLVLLPQQIAEPGKKPRFAFMYLLVDKKTGMALDFDTAIVENGLESLQSRFPDYLIKALLKIKWQPDTIEIRHPAIYTMTRQVLHPTKIKVVLKPKLNQVDNVLDSIDQFG